MIAGPVAVIPLACGRLELGLPIISKSAYYRRGGGETSGLGCVYGEGGKGEGILK